MRKLTNEEFLQRVKKQIGNEYTFLEPYAGRHIKIKVRHNKCGHIFSTSPGRFFQGHGCPYCHGGIKKNDTWFKNKVKKLVGNEYTFLEPYKNSSAKIKCKHNKCGNTWAVSPNSFLRGTRCPYCSKHRRWTVEQYQCFLDEKWGHLYKVLGHKQNLMKVQHLKCGYIWWTQPKRLHNKKRCPKCHNNRLLTTKEFIKNVNKKFPNEFEVMSEYKGSKEKILVKHLKCDHTWWIKPNNLLMGYGCPYCNQSHGERIIDNILEQTYSLKNGIDFQYGYVLPNKLHLDFYLPKQRIGIEYDGEQHFRAVKFFGGQKGLIERQEHDHQKDQYCKDHQIKLIRIPYTVNTYDGIKQRLSSLRKEDLKS